MTSLARLNTASDEDFVTTLAGIYEHSDWVPQRLAHQRPFPSVENLRLAMRQVLENATDPEKLALIRAHPDLAGKLAKAGELTQESSREQAGLGLDRLAEDEYEIFQNMNQQYRNQFGFPFIICARLTTKPGVLEAFAKRLANSREQEISEALTQIHQIAQFRLGDTVQG